MKKKRNIRGFTMAELLIVVAVITVLSGVGFIAVQAHQKNVAQVEANTIAKEIFFAAQNHLTMAESQGYLNPGTIAYGTSEGAKKADEPANAEIYYFAVPTHSFTGTNSSVLDMMLPFGSIDDTIRLSGNYVIRYQANPARVLDVWYGRASNQQYTGKYDANPISLGIAKLLTEAANEKPNYGAVIGYYGGDAALENGVTLNAPTITVTNAERLTVTVDTTNVKTGVTDQTFLGNPEALTVKLLITGKSSNAMAAIPMSNPYRVTADTNKTVFEVALDEITRPFASGDGGHFAEIVYDSLTTGNTIINVEGAFIPGENITVQAVAFSTTHLASIAYSNEVTTNSLFADYDEINHVAKISCFRHLENLDPLISGLDTNAFVLTKAEQIADLEWTGKDANENPVKIYKKPLNKTGPQDSGTAEGCFLPVNIDYALEYDGGIKVETDGTRYHRITGVKVSGGEGTGSSSETPFSGDGGLFGTVTGALTVQNLELIDFNINCTGNAGALAGTLGKNGGPTIQITNVLAHNSKDVTTTIASSGGSAGGLIGSMTGVTVQKCAAALVVNANKNAGGLIGECHGGSVEASYSAGHTTEKKENDAVTASEYGKTTPAYNVTGGTNAGGLIGEQGQTDVKCCYSTCSVSGGTTAGGLVGESGKAIQKSYATGLVKGASNSAKLGALAGYNVSGTFTDCSYFEIINPTETTENGSTTYGYLPPVGDTATVTGITALDASADSYNTFCGAPADWKNAEPSTASGLIDLYYATVDKNKVAKYNLKTVSQLGAEGIQEDATTGESAAPADFVATHYGDWPAPEILVINVTSGGGSGGIGF